MIVNLTLNREQKFHTPSILLLSESRYVITLISIRALFRDPFQGTKIICLRTNLVDVTETNPHQILTFFTVSEGANLLSHNVFSKQEYKLNNRNLAEGFFILSEVGVWDEIPLVDGAMQLYIVKKEVDT